MCSSKESDILKVSRGFGPNMVREYINGSGAGKVLILGAGGFRGRGAFRKGPSSPHSLVSIMASAMGYEGSETRGVIGDGAVCGHK